MTDAPSETFDALNPGDFFSDQLDEVEKQWLYAQVIRLINTHSRSAPKTQKLLKPLVEEFFPGKGPPEEIPERKEPVNKASGISATLPIRQYLLDQLAYFLTQDLPLEKKVLRIFQDALADFELSPGQISIWLKRLGHHQLAGKPEIAVQTTHDYVRTALLDCTEDHALFHFHRPLVRGVFIMLELKKDCRTEAYHSPLHATVKKVRVNPLKESEYQVQVEFQQLLEEKHGILDLLKPPSQSTDQFLEFGDIPSPSRSLKLKLVGCPLCEETRLPFWSLKPGAIRESRNVFGFPVYHSPYPGFEECDFHRLRVTVCPRCFYASSRIEDFIVQAGEPFQKDRVMIRKLWDHSCPELKKTLNELPSRFGTHSRTNDEAVLSYKIAIQSLAIMDELQPDQDTKLELLTLGLLCSEKLEKLGRSEESLEQKIETLKRIGDPTSGLDKANRIRVIFWKCLLELDTGQKKKASISLRQLESLALGRETDLYTANLLDQSLNQARKALLKKQI